jgi:Zn-dependent protease with chaperone function
VPRSSQCDDGRFSERSPARHDETTAPAGGLFLYAFVALAVIMNVFGYWFSDSIALKASRAQPVNPGTRPALETMVHDLAERAQLPVPRLYTIASQQPNAFATGRNPRHAAAESLERGAQAAPLAVNPATASLYIVNPLRKQGVATLFSAHPPIAERVPRLRALDGDLVRPVANTLLEEGAR